VGGLKEIQNPPAFSKRVSESTAGSGRLFVASGERKFAAERREFDWW